MENKSRQSHRYTRQLRENKAEEGRRIKMAKTIP
jgi:hypothetical protein